MAVYYIDPENGEPVNSGLRPEQPLNTNKNLYLMPGDSVLFKRGSLIRDSLWNVNGADDKPITYGAYGEGENPVFCGSWDVSRECDWKELSAHLWKCTRSFPTAVCNLVFNQSFGGSMQWTVNELKEQGDWWDSTCEGITRDEQEVLLYSLDNPAKVYDRIECVLLIHEQLAYAGHNMIIQDLTFCNNGFGIAGETGSRNLTIRNCRFEFIGGQIWSQDEKIRFGNAVEFWNTAENVIVECCVFKEIYDSAVTHQGSEECRAAEGLWIRDNLFLKCGMAAYEQRDVVPRSGEFRNNVCADAGCGFSHLRIKHPRTSEIWPQPMGHHIFLWRMEKPTDDSHFVIANNVFLNAPYGAAIYSVMHPEAEEQLIIDNNVYLMKERALIIRMAGQNFDSFEAYRSATGREIHSTEG